ncbi:MAG: hypothetical protein R3C16_03665 [Hyphomonadaceae bacterium]
MSDLTRGDRLQIMLTREELVALDDWRFKARMPSRAAAVRELLKRGLAAEGYGEAQPGRKSRDFGVTGGGKAANGDGAITEPPLPESEET